MLGRLLTGIFAKSAGTTATPRGQPSSRQAIETYLRSHPVRKLHLGAGPGSPPGWLSTDIRPQSDKVVYLDAAAVFPIADETFDYVFSEHMVEHLPWQAGRAMLQECHRVLKPGGTIRVATPDLAVLLGLYGEQRSPLADRYVRWIVDSFMPEIRIYSASFVINNAFRNWGHKFLYDAELLEMALRAAGFTGIRRCAYGESADANLRAMESHGRTIRNQEMAAFETMVFEADRPLRLQPAT